MKTWEMIKELTENPSKKFKRTKDGVEFKTSQKIVDSIKVGTYVEEAINYRSRDCVLLEDDWTEVKQSVSLLEALQAWANGETITCELNGLHATYNPKEGSNLVDFSGRGLSSKEINQGIWYIEND